MTCAAEAGHLHIVEYLRANGCPWVGISMIDPAARGVICDYSSGVDVMYVHGTTVPVVTAGRGHLEVLVWAHENGCPWSDYSWERAVQGGHGDVIIWARANGCPGSAGGGAVPYSSASAASVR